MIPAFLVSVSAIVGTLNPNPPVPLTSPCTYPGEWGNPNNSRAEQRQVDRDIRRWCERERPKPERMTVCKRYLAPWRYRQ